MDVFPTVLPFHIIRPGRRTAAGMWTMNYCQTSGAGITDIVAKEYIDDFDSYCMSWGRALKHRRRAAS
jgi:hypothetical protein